MHIKKKLIFCILIITFLIVIMAIRFHLKTDEYIDTNNQIEIEENIEDSNIQIENVIETETKMPINNEIIENNNTNLKNDTDKQITKTEKNNKMKIHQITKIKKLKKKFRIYHLVIMKNILKMVN